MAFHNVFLLGCSGPPHDFPSPHIIAWEGKKCALYSRCWQALCFSDVQLDLLVSFSLSEKCPTLLFSFSHTGNTLVTVDWMQGAELWFL